MNNIGLNEKEISSIKAIFSKYENIDQVILYGSRAKGNFKPASDIDLALLGSNINLSQINEIESEMDELLLPYKFDISVFNSIDNPDLKKQILQIGLLFYKKEK
jgi:predicted nucleotidyltransferase